MKIRISEIVGTYKLIAQLGAALYVFGQHRIIDSRFSDHEDKRRAHNALYNRYWDTPGYGRHK